MDPMTAPPIGQWGCVLADPPWYFRNHSEAGEGKNPVAHYACMPLADIMALDMTFVGAANCALVMWATAPMLPQALQVMSAWGFKFKTAGAWAKQSSTGTKWAFGTGYIFRSAAEFILVGTRGEPKVRSRSIRNLIVAPVREHSRKPAETHEMCEALFDGPYLEMFAREPRPGWTVWGNQTNKFGGAA